jgi:hypothetical protein
LLLIGIVQLLSIPVARRIVVGCSQDTVAKVCQTRSHDFSADGEYSATLPIETI